MLVVLNYFCAPQERGGRMILLGYFSMGNPPIEKYLAGRIMLKTYFTITKRRKLSHSETWLVYHDAFWLILFMRG